MPPSLQLDDYAAVKAYLYSLKYHGAKYGIDRMRLLSRELGAPENSYPILHIAGTNGKGSTAAMLDSIYRQAGYKTGLFTSPHLVQLGERIQVNRRILSQEKIVAGVRELMPIAEKLGAIDPDDAPSFFEFLTALGLLAFAEEKVDVALVEVGLGGRLDATNVVTPELSLITSIGYDHTEILGDTLTEIATEKAGIVKPGKPVLIGFLPKEAEDAVRRIAKERGSLLYSVTDEYGCDDAAYPSTNLVGHCQRRNAALATMAVEILSGKLPVPQEAIRRGLSRVVWEGRWDERKLPDGRTIIFDAAHNEEAATMLEDNLAHLVQKLGYKPTILCGSLGERRAHAILAAVARYAGEVVLMHPAQQRALSFEELEAAMPKDFAGSIRRALVKEIVPAPGICTAGKAGETVVATGSIYLLGELMEALYFKSAPAEQALQDGPGSQRLRK
jgi:dihydrofolate synthase / folylpolyglutamate synthase